MNFNNPYRPGAGHPPPHLAGRENEVSEFVDRILVQDVILENVILTGLRGVGKTVLLEKLKPLAQEAGWRWVGTDLSESASLSEEKLAVRLLSDLAVVTSSLVAGKEEQLQLGFAGGLQSVDTTLNYEALFGIYGATPGLVSDKLKKVLETVWVVLRPQGGRGVVFAYDEAQTMSNHPERDEYPLSLLLDVFQSIQRKGIPFLLVLTGLPTLFTKLVEARTFAERMFHIIVLDRLTAAASQEAIEVPVEAEDCPVRFNPESVSNICGISGGYPYFIQFICKEVFDLFIQGETSVPVDAIMRKLDADFFAGRWARATDRQRDLLWVAAHLDATADEFTIRELCTLSKEVLLKPIGPSQTNQMLVALQQASLVFKNRHGRYCFAVPLMDDFIKRQEPPEGVSREGATFV